MCFQGNKESQVDGRSARSVFTVKTIYVCRTEGFPQ